MRRLRTIGAFTALLMVAACRPPHDADKTSSASSEDLKPAMQALAPPAEATITELKAPESVLHDVEQDVYFISNINGGMQDVDHNGFISRVHPDTLMVDLKWIESGRNGVRLDGPKGMAIVGNTLFVSDVTAVRKFDRHTGAPLGEVPLAGATFINDLATDGKSVYVSDTGFDVGPGETFVDNGSQAIWKITGDRAEKIASGPGLGHPNGLEVVDGKLWVVTFGSDELYTLDGHRRANVVKLPSGELDGLAHLGDGSMVVTSWKASQIFRGPPSGPFHAILAGIDSPADIGYDARRHRLLVPHPTADQVTIHPLQ
jgi:hypothetical protein